MQSAQAIDIIGQSCSAEVSNARVLLLQDCSLQGGQIQANASCISGLVCCDATCAAALGASSLQVNDTGMHLLSGFLKFGVPGIDINRWCSFL